MVSQPLSWSHNNYHGLTTNLTDLVVDYTHFIHDNRDSCSATQPALRPHHTKVLYVPYFRQATMDEIDVTN